VNKYASINGYTSYQMIFLHSMKIRRIIVGLVLLLAGFITSAQQRISVEDYILIYKDVAIDKMEAYGIPAFFNPFAQDL